MRCRTLASSLYPLGLVLPTLALNLVPLSARAAFERETVDDAVAAWGKGLLDVDGDGLLDVIVGGGELGGGVDWYRAPNWDRFQIATSGGGDDIAHYA